MIADLIRDRVIWDADSTKLLDFGCGVHGSVAASLCELTAQTVATDSDQAAVDGFNERCSLQGLAPEEVAAVPSTSLFADSHYAAYFDVAVASLVYHHVERDERLTVTQRLRSRLQPGGVLVIVDLAAVPGVNGFDREELAALMRDAGFKNIAVERGPRIKLHNQERTHLLITIGYT